ncbi:Putative protein of unknown function [Podospora comata]|uniref:CBM-cenC domain-containing protein n=1 Tax=Podospora comata TaxID=48703 RepID=A0ABY6SM55_PODCO|nr:Putative protein of unknown function [Podospora comata]
MSISPAEATSACSCIGITTVTASAVTSYVSATESATLIDPRETEPSSEPTGTEISSESTVKTDTSAPTDITTIDETITSAATDCPAATTIVSTITQVEVQTTIHTASQDVATVTETQTATLPPVVETVTETATAETLVSTITEVLIETETHTHVQTDTHLQTDIYYHTESHIHTDTQFHTETQTQTLTETETLIQTQTEVETQTQTLVETQIQTQTATLIQTQVETETHTQIQLETSIQISSFTTTVTSTASASASACPTVAAAASPIKNGNFEGNSLRGWNILATTGSGGTSSVGTTTNHMTPQGRHFLHLYTGYNVHPRGPSSLTYGQTIACVAGVRYRLYYDTKLTTNSQSGVGWSVKVGVTTMHSGNGAAFDWMQRSSTFDCHANSTRNVLQLEVRSTVANTVVNMSFDNFVVVPVTTSETREA